MHVIKLIMMGCALQQSVSQWVNNILNAYALQYMGKLEPIPVDIGFKMWYNLNRAPVHHRAAIHTHIYNDGQFRVDS